MSKFSTEIVIGMDMSDKKSEICVLDASGEVLKRAEVANTLGGLNESFSELDKPEKVLIAMEAGTHSPWISLALSEMGFDVLVGNPRKLRAIWTSERKSDTRDAEMLARIARFDKKLFHPIKHRNKDSQAMLAVLKSRDALVKSRTQLVNSARGMLKSMGIAISSCDTRYFSRKALEEMPEEYTFALQEMLEIITNLSAKIDAYEKKIDKLCEEKYPETKALRAIKGVGPITALTFVLTIENPDRFRKSRDVAAFLGLVPKRDQSGEIDKQLGITKTGNEFLRRLLVQSAQYMMGPFGDDCELRRFGEKLSARGGKAAKKKAIVAVARKLSIVLHNLWKNETEYDPFFNASRKESTKKAA